MTLNDFLNFVVTHEPLIGPLLTLIVGGILIPYVGRLYRLHKEQAMMIGRKLLENTGLVIFGSFEGQLQSDYLGGILTAFFGETLFDLIADWNKNPSPNIVIPSTPYQAEHLREILAVHASRFILQSNRLDPYFRGVKTYGTPSYRFAKFVVCLMRPDAAKLQAHDYPRIVIIEMGALENIAADGHALKPQTETPDGYVWVACMRELAKLYFSGRQEGIAVLEIPVEG